MWKSRWSSVIFVSRAVSYSIPATRFRAKAWDETSMTTYSQPASFMRYRNFCKSTVSGVVLWEGMGSSPIITLMVPIRPHGWPAARRTRRIIFVLVVLPFVPVTPIIRRDLPG